MAVDQICDELLRSEEFRDKHGEAHLAITQAKMWQEMMAVYTIEIGDVKYLYIKLLGREPDMEA